MNSYWALVHQEGDAFGISFPDVPGCISAADTLEGVLVEGREALSSHLAWMRAEGDAVPRPRPHAALQADPETREAAEGATWHLVTPKLVQAPRLRVNIMIDPGLLRNSDQAAEASGMTRSGLIETALRAHLDRGRAPSITGEAGPWQAGGEVINVMEALREQIMNEQSGRQAIERATGSGRMVSKPGAKRSLRLRTP